MAQYWGNILPWSCLSRFRVAIGAANKKDNPVRRGILIPACTIGVKTEGEPCGLVLDSKGFNNVFIAVMMGILPNVPFLCKNATEAGCLRSRLYRSNDWNGQMTTGALIALFQKVPDDPISAPFNQEGPATRA
jgi:hypothetical protein